MASAQPHRGSSLQRLPTWPPCSAARTWVPAARAIRCRGGALRARTGAFVAGFSALFGLALLAQLAAAHAAMAAWGLEYVLFALLVGIMVRQVAPPPAWLAEAVRTEYYIKMGLVVLGASILFNEILRAGALGVAQALVVVLSVWFFCFSLARRLGVDDELATMLASPVSICGVSAAIAACGAIQGDRRNLSYLTSLVLWSPCR